MMMMMMMMIVWSETGLSRPICLRKRLRLWSQWR